MAAITTARPGVGPEALARRVSLFDLPVDALTLDETVDRIEQLIERGTPSQHVVLNAAKVVQASTSPDLADIVRGCEIVNADGMSVVWASRLLGRALPERVAGIDLMDAVLARAAARGHRVYFLGARAEVVRTVVEIESERHPGLCVAGARDGYWSPEEEAEVVADVAGARPHVLLVAMSSPRKEEFLSRHLHAMGVPFAMGVGGSFDVVAGLTSRAPRWMQRAGLEWLHRLGQEPGRMWKRYLVGNARFTVLVARELIRRRKLQETPS
jgi:N-acetylglucosaminyldiphosphoundecaprenol N-acetyl-beta-D-mannosaminyltransferase